jgi:hypothetical protein
MGPIAACRGASAAAVQGTTSKRQKVRGTPAGESAKAAVTLN